MSRKRFLQPSFLPIPTRTSWLSASDQSSTFLISLVKLLMSILIFSVLTSTKACAFLLSSSARVEEEAEEGTELPEAPGVETAGLEDAGAALEAAATEANVRVLVT